MLVTLVAPGLRQASAGPIDAQILAGPGGFFSAGDYYTPVVATPSGGRVTFSNYDIEPHNVVSTKRSGRERRARPLFASRLLDFNESASVAGVRRLNPG